MNALGRAIIISFFVFFFSAVFILPVSAAGPTTITGEITSSTTWTKENSPYKVLGNVVVKAPLTIEAGTIVKFNTSGLDGLKIQNNFFVNGTREDPVVFTSFRDDFFGGDTNGDGSKTKPQIGNWSQMSFNPSQDKEFKIKYAKIFYASTGVSFYPSAGQTKDMSVKNSEIRKNGIGIVIGNAKALIENNIISENANYGISANVSTKTPKAINNSITNNAVGARGVNSSNPSQTALDAKGNWWGDKTGPQNENNLNGKGNSVTGQVSFDPWTKEDPIQTPDPAIIIPGIMGSWEKDGKWQIDPIFHTYDNLFEEFENNGYISEKNLFTFPYQWRDSNKVNAVELRAKIQEIKNKTNRPKVDIVAHSMGGLLAREYIESSYYENDVDQLITIGTPHLGAPKDYIKWEAGESFFDLFDMAAKRIFMLEAAENGFGSVFDYIHNRPIASVQELLPTYDYLFDVENNYALRESYPSNYPRNEFLENLNIFTNVQKLNNTELTKIIGKQNNNESTISGFNVLEKSGDKLWRDGYPKNFSFPLLWRSGINFSDGDKTVPLYSAEATQIPADKTIYLESEHNALPTDAQKDILEILTGKRPAIEVRKWHIPDILIILLHSPVDMQVISPSGEKIGKNFETGGEFSEIEGAFYTGYITNTEFLTIPNPEDGEYKILTQGTGTGEYEIEIAKIAENEDTDKTEESTATISGTAEVGKTEETTIEVSGSKVEKLTVSESGQESNDDILDSKNNSKNSGEPSALENNSKKSLAVNQTRVRNLDALKGSVRQRFKSGEIKTRKEAREIAKKLAHIRVYLKRYEAGTLPEKLNASKIKANRHIDKLISRVRRDIPKKITESAGNSLIEDLNGMKIE